jgi:HEAT repeat protein
VKNDPVELALGRLDEIPLHTDEGRKQIAKALASKSNLVAAKAARIAGDAQWSELTGDLATAFDRFLNKGGADLDKGCAALNALARALYALDYSDPELYLKGMRRVQIEPVWGGSVDTAAELRAVCAMGLASTSWPDKLRELVQMLVDPEWQARAGAARALASVGSEPALLLLRLKALSGDQEPEVLSDCFNGLLAAEGAEAVRLVASFALVKDQGLREGALLSLGASRHADTVEWLKERFTRVADVETRQCILLSLATSRTEAAIAFLVELIRDGSGSSSELAVAAMDINRTDRRLQEEVKQALRERRARENP